MPWAKTGGGGWGRGHCIQTTSLVRLLYDIRRVISSSPFHRKARRTTGTFFPLTLSVLVLVGSPSRRSLAVHHTERMQISRRLGLSKVW